MNLDLFLMVASIVFTPVLVANADALSYYLLSHTYVFTTESLIISSFRTSAERYQPCVPPLLHVARAIALCYHIKGNCTPMQGR